MNLWGVAALVLSVGLVPCGIVSLRGRLLDRLAGLELAGMVLAQVCVLWAVAIDRPAFVDIGLTIGVLAFGAGLVFARFFERWL
jgi:multisubunit Na+/H+ antiporter MnhF subunit